MLNFFLRDGSKIKRRNFDGIDSINLESSEILWIDLLHPSSEEIEYIAKTFNLDVPSSEEREEIEESSRYWEDPDSITINSNFVLHADKNKPDSKIVTFILFSDILFSVRYSDSQVFDDIQRQVLLSPKHFEDASDLIGKIYEVRVEKDADFIEGVTRSMKKLRRRVFEGDIKDHGEILGILSDLQEMNTTVRESLFDKRRTLTLLLKSSKIDSDIKKDLLISLKDLNSLVEFTMANMNTLDNIQNLFTNQINIEQNKIIKAFTVATMAMMPPTLIGTIYGMNFAHMPELQWKYGYPVSIVIMIISTVLPVLFFKKRGWL